jgi:hypothetical protein
MPTRSKLNIIGRNICRNYVHKLRFLAGMTESISGATHSDLPPERSLAYIDTVFADYLAYAGISAAEVSGKRVLEIGPGDNLGVALKFLAAGCSQVVCLDKFSAKRNPDQQLRIYRALRETLSLPERQRFDEAVSLEGGFRPNPARLTYLCGKSIERAHEVFAAESFDYIVSRAVLMEVADSDAGFASMDRLLKGGGMMIHKIETLHDYKMFEEFGYSPLEFLTIPQWIYRRMVSDCGGPNRRPVTYYRRKMEGLRYEATIHVVNLVSCNLKFAPRMTRPPRQAPEYRQALSVVQKIRGRLRREFRDLDDEDLIVRDVFLVARKPEAKTTCSGMARACTG